MSSSQLSSNIATDPFAPADRPPAELRIARH